MLEKAVAAVKADKAKALAMFIKGEGGFKDRDLYPFCFSIADGKLDAAPPITIGKDVRACCGCCAYGSIRQKRSVAGTAIKPGTCRASRRAIVEANWTLCIVASKLLVRRDTMPQTGLRCGALVPQSGFRRYHSALG